MSDFDTYSSLDDDPILGELRRIRAEMAAEYGYDVRRQVEDSQRRQFLDGHDVVARSKTGGFEVVFKGAGKAHLNCHEVPPTRVP